MLGRGPRVGSRLYIVVLWTGAIEHLVVDRVVILPGGVWDALVVQDKHVKRVDIVATPSGGLGAPGGGGSVSRFCQCNCSKRVCPMDMGSKWEESW